MNKEPYSEEEVAEGVWQVAGFHGWGSGVNAAILAGDKHAIVVDTLQAPREARRLSKTVRRMGLEPLSLVNTHWHTDHTVGNSLYDCPIWGQTLGTRYLKRYWPKWVGGPLDKRAEGLLLKVPDRLIVHRASLDLDGEEIQLIHLPGHTPDSIGVFLPRRRILVAGDAVMELPFVWFGDSRDSIRSFRLIERLRPRMILQGHGPTCSSDRLATDIRYLEKVRSSAREARHSGMTRKQFIEAPLEKFLPTSRARELGEGWLGAHQLNLQRVWTEVA